MEDRLSFDPPTFSAAIDFLSNDEQITMLHGNAERVSRI